MPRYVILEHDHPFLHWDLMLEEGETLATWRLSALPGRERLVIPAERIGAHRLAYLDYEGPLSGNRGRVNRWDVGVYVQEQESPTVYRLKGGRWQGKIEIGDTAITFIPS